MKDIQRHISSKVLIEDRFSETDSAGGVDQSFSNDYVYSATVIQNPRFEALESKYSKMEINFPYVPGLLAFREIPPILKTWKKLERKPDLLLVDAHGIAHPRRFGLASHVGVVLDVPAIGVAKNFLAGEFESPEEVGESTNLELEGEVVGKVLKSKEGCNPIFVSPGHRISVETSLEIVKKFLKDHKLPEPIYQADRYANSVKK